MDMLTFNCTHLCGNANWMLFDIGVRQWSRLELYIWESCMNNF